MGRKPVPGGPPLPRIISFRADPALFAKLEKEATKVSRQSGKMTRVSGILRQAVDEYFEARRPQRR